VIDSAAVLKVANPLALWNPFMPVDWLVNQLEWLTDQFFARAGLALVWMLTSLPPGLGYVGYIVVALWLSGWVSSIRTNRSSVLTT
jgi:hypothetical protein